VGKNRIAFLLAALAALLTFAGPTGAMTQITASASPWIATDKADYAPGSTVHVTGGNWEPGEDVRIVTNDTLGNTWSQADTVVADPTGGLTYEVVLPNYFVSDYTVSAMSASGSATTTFTDAVNYQFLGKDGSAHGTSGAEESLGSVNVGSSVTATCPNGLDAKGTGLGGGQSSSYAISYVSGYGDNSTLSSRTTVTPSSGAFNGNGTICTSLTITTSGLAAATYHGELQMRNTGGATAGTEFYFFTFTVTQPQQPTTVSGVAGSGAYGGTSAFTATLKSGTTPLSGKTISFTLNGTGVGTATTDGSGIATLGGVSTNGINAGTQTAAVGASFAGDADFSASSATGDLALGKAASSTSVSCPASVIYDGSAKTPCTSSVTGAGGLNQSLSVGYSNNAAVGTATATASFGGDANHDPSSDSETFAITPAASTTAVSCPSQSLTYDGSAKTPCTATVTGAGGLNQSLTVSYSNNTGAGTATASASYGGDENHSASSDSETFTIDKAASSVTVTCPDSRTYTGSPLEPCSAKTTGAGGLDVDLTVSYADNINAGTATASASYDGDANHHGSSGSATFTIDKALSTVTVTCADGPFVYTGSPHTPCSAKTTGAGGLDVDLTVFYGDNINAGTASASANYDGDANHLGDGSSKTFTIDRAPSHVEVSCAAGPFTYNGSPHTPCSANVTGAGGLDHSTPVEYANNIGAGTATASASFGGDANHLSDDASRTFTIEKADSTTSVSCPDSRTYTGNPLEPCSAKATGAGSLDVDLSVSYADNVNAGTATASASYDGDANHHGSSGSETFTIEKAPSTVTVNCGAGPFTYNGSPQTPCSATVTGVGGLNHSLTVSYADNVGAGTATASASYAGDANHLGDSNSRTFTIDKATPTINLTWTGWTFDGAAHPATGSVIGVGGTSLGSPTFTYYSGTGTSGTPLAGAPSGVGAYTVLASFSGNTNYTAASKTKTVSGLYRWDGYLQPINDTAHQGLYESSFKLGSTIPAKFQLKKADGTVAQAGALPVFSRSTTPVSCDTQISPETLDTDVAFTGTMFRWDGQQYIYNWSTKGLKAGEYRIYATLDDSSKQYVDICLR
jgi:hypothetical protein